MRCQCQNLINLIRVLGGQSDLPAVVNLHCGFCFVENPVSGLDENKDGRMDAVVEPRNEGSKDGMIGELTAATTT